MSNSRALQVSENSRGQPLLEWDDEKWNDEQAKEAPSDGEEDWEEAPKISLYLVYFVSFSMR